MADSKGNIFDKLSRLLSTNVVVRPVGPRKDRIRVIDPSHLQSVGTQQNAKYIDRYTRLHGVRPPNSTAYGQNYNFYASKVELYTEYEVMDQDPIIAAALDVYSDETILKDDMGDILRISSQDEGIKKVLYNLFYDVLNIEFNLWPWVRNMCKYGDMYLHLHIEPEYGIINAIPMSPYEVTREEGMDPKNPYTVTFKQQSTGNRIYENYEVAHFRNLTDSNFLPYGKSMIEGARKGWKQLTLMEDAMLIHRIMRAPEKRIFKIDVGNIPQNEVDAHMQKIMAAMRKTPYMDPQTGDYNLKFNMQNMLEDYFLPVRGGQSGTEIDTLSGMEFTGIDDIEYLRNKMMAALKIPKSFLGYDEALSGKASLAGEDVRFARTIERIQRVVISELYKIAMVHLTAQGFKDSELVDFELTMTSPSTIYEQEKLTLYQSKVSLAGDMIDKKLASREWIYEHIFNFNERERIELEEQIVEDQLNINRLNAILESGEDPFTKLEGEEGGDEGDADTMDGDSPFGGDDNPDPTATDGGGSADVPKAEPDAESTEIQPFESVDSLGRSMENRPKAPKGGWDGAGRPKEPMKYNSHEHPRGYDPTGKVGWKNARREGITRYGDLMRSKLLPGGSLLNESNIIDENIINQ